MLLSAASLIVLLGLIALAVDLGYIFLVRTQLQAAADSAAMAGATALGQSFEAVFANAEHYAQLNLAAGEPVQLQHRDVELGLWDTTSRTFTPRAEGGNAVRVTARRDATSSGQVALFFGRFLGTFAFSRQASAVAVANPRDIAFVVDLSGSMNDDTEPCWATDAINDTFAGDYGPIGSLLMQLLYTDFGYGAFPGTSEYLGQSFGVAQDKWAYAELTKDDGPLSGPNIAAQYRIATTDTEAVRKKKAYSAIIDLQIARLMPAAKPAPNSTTNYAYWEKYLDYLLEPVTISKKSTQGTPPTNRGILPAGQDSDRITGFNNPNQATFPSVGSSVPEAFRNQIGYRSCLQFMLDHGRDLKPTGAIYTPLSRYSSDCPWHTETVGGSSFRFPPREQPTHAARRALIAALQVVRERNQGVTDPNQCDWVSIVAFDALSNGGPVLEQPLTSDYAAAMQVCTHLQAVGDKGTSTATEVGLARAHDHLKSQREGGQGRWGTNKVVVLLTDGVPNLYTSTPTEISQFIRTNPSEDFYNDGTYAYDAVLMQVAAMQQKNWSVFPVGVGLGTDYDFMDRLARLGGTADEAGHSPRGSGNPAEYEQRLSEIFRKIITNPQVRLVQ